MTLPYGRKCPPGLPPIFTPWRRAETGGVSDRPPDDDPFTDRRAWFDAAATRERVVRGADRRHQERRGLGFAARRRDDVDLNASRRDFLNHYLRHLPATTLHRLIDGLWLGRASDAELSVLVSLAIEPPPSPRPIRRRRAGRPAVHQRSDILKEHSSMGSCFTCKAGTRTSAVGA